MLTKTFKLGDKVRFIRNNTNGGSRYGAKDDLATIVLLSTMDTHRVHLRLDRKPSWEYRPIASINDLELARIESKDTFEDDGVE